MTTIGPLLQRLALLGGLAVGTQACSVFWPYHELEGSSGGSVGGSDGSGGGVGGRPANDLCPTPGWCPVPDTRLSDHCPPSNNDFDYASFCGDVLRVPSSGVADRARDRLVIWGGAASYPGNEVYVLDVAARTLERKDDPTPPAQRPCDGSSDGKPVNRETFDGLASVPDADGMFLHGGNTVCADGGGSGDTWLLDLATFAWARKDPHPGPVPDADLLGPVAADYDAEKRRVLVHTQLALWQWELDTNAFTALRNVSMAFSVVGRVDPVRRLFVVAGCKGCDGGLFAYHIDDPKYASEDWTDEVVGCDDWLTQPAPGFDFDPVTGLFVAWPNQGAAVYTFDPDTLSCARVDFPTGPTHVTDFVTRGRFRYLPALGLFALISDPDGDAHVLRL